MPGFLTQSKRLRILTIVVFFLFAVMVSAVGTLVPLNPQDAAAQNSNNKEILSMDLLHRTAAFFENNFLRVCLLMFIPVVGVILGSIILFDTGSLIAAYSVPYKFPPVLVLLLLFIFPSTWLEMLAYATAFSESFWFIRRSLEGKLAREIVNLGKMVLISAVLLAVAAFLEALVV
jgi:hypothetical protein